MIGTIGLLGPEARERVARLATAIERAREPGRDGVAPAAGVPLADRPIDHACLAAAVRRVAAVLADAGALSADEVAAIEGHADLEGDLAAVLAWATGRRASGDISKTVKVTGFVYRVNRPGVQAWFIG